MRTFTLTYADDGLGVERTIEFDALDAAGALHLASSTRRGRIATLSEGDRTICTMERRPTGKGYEVWVIGPAPQHA